MTSVHTLRKLGDQKYFFIIKKSATFLIVLNVSILLLKTNGKLKITFANILDISFLHEMTNSIALSHVVGVLQRSYSQISSKWGFTFFHFQKAYYYGKVFCHDLGFCFEVFKYLMKYFKILHTI